jgi:flagellar P-ring protein precursor FlgI
MAILRTNILTFLFLILMLSMSIFPGVLSASAERIRDIAEFEGFRENRIIGYGLVIGLNGTGDKGTATKKAIANMLQRLGITVRASDIKTKNSAAVIVTASLPPFPKPGMRVDALVSSIADAKSLQGGTLLLTPLKGPDGKVYALAQGPVSVGGFVGGRGGATVQKNHPTVGRIPNGVIIEREPSFELGNGEFRLFLKNPDFSLASKVAKRINDMAGPGYARAVDPSTVIVKVPVEYADTPVEFLSRVQELQIQVDTPAKVIINERTGTVVIGEKVKLRPVAISHGNLTIEIKREYTVSQPPPFAPESAETVVVPETETTVKEESMSVVELSGTTLGEIIKALNALGVSPRDLIAILQALKAAGALRAELEII